MKTQKNIAHLFLFCFLLFFITPTSYALNAVASIKRVKGEVQVERGERQKKLMTGRVGLVLNDHDVVITGNRAKATILFRDGSEIRLFPKTRFQITKSKETTSGGKRKFINRFMLKLGSFWGKFSKGKQSTLIRTPTATAGIKGTTVAFSQKNGKFSAALSSGVVSIQNQDGKIDLQPGQMVENLEETGSIQEKIVDLPYQIRINPEHQKIKPPKQGDEATVFFTLQLIDTKANKNIAKSGEVYVSINSDKLVFKQNIRLNSRGYARIQAKVLPFGKKEYQKGRLEIYAVMDGEEFMNVGAGHTLVTFDVPKGAGKTFRIDVNSGSIN